MQEIRAALVRLATPGPGYTAALKARGFVIYPGKVTAAETLRIGTIGDIHPEDMRRLIRAVRDCMFWRER